MDSDAVDARRFFLVPLFLGGEKRKLAAAPVGSSHDLDYRRANAIGDYEWDSPKQVAASPMQAGSEHSGDSEMILTARSTSAVKASAATGFGRHTTRLQQLPSGSSQSGSRLG